MAVQFKYEVREEVWREMGDAGVGRFPFPLRGRIPNFKGAEDAADRLAALDAWQRAEAIKANADSPHRPVRCRARASVRHRHAPALDTGWEAACPLRVLSRPSSPARAIPTGISQVAARSGEVADVGLVGAVQNEGCPRANGGR